MVSMARIAALVLVAALAACDGMTAMDVPHEDAGAAGDTVPECTEWGMNSHGERFCLSTEPVACPGPWPCK
jgi:hypothetical protein